jgi:hypothetical protein
MRFVPRCVAPGFYRAFARGHGRSRACHRLAPVVRVFGGQMTWWRAVSGASPALLRRRSADAALYAYNPSILGRREPDQLLRSARRTVDQVAESVAVRRAAFNRFSSDGGIEGDCKNGPASIPGFGLGPGDDDGLKDARLLCQPEVSDLIEQMPPPVERVGVL